MSATASRRSPEFSIAAETAAIGYRRSDIIQCKRPATSAGRFVLSALLRRKTAFAATSPQSCQGRCCISPVQPLAQPSWPGIAVQRTASLRSPMSRPSTSYFVAKAWMPGTRPGMTAENYCNTLRCYAPRIAVRRTASLRSPMAGHPVRLASSIPNERTLRPQRTNTPSTPYFELILCRSSDTVLTACLLSEGVC
jgi:hypothetical protein